MRPTEVSRSSLGGFVRDLRHAARALRRTPGFTAIAIATLTLGIASATAAFSVLDTIVLRGMPYRDADQLRTIFEHADNGNARTPSYPTFLDWRAQTAQSPVIEGLAFVRGDQASLPGARDDRQLVAYVSPGFFRLMGGAPLLGRTFAPDEEQEGSARVAILSYDLFVDRFGGEPSVVGRVVDLDSIPTTIIGVMPRSFAYPNFGGGGSGWAPPKLWQPIAVFGSTHPGVLTRRELHVDSQTLVRLRSGVDSAQAVAAMATIERRLAASYPADQAHWTSVDLQSMSNALYGNVPRQLALVAGAVALVMLLACANVATLFLIRAGGRARDTAVRGALGASRWQVARPPVLEAALAALMAGVLGILAAAALVGFTRHSLAGLLPFGGWLHLDVRAVVFAMAACLMTALLVGAAPALQTSAVQAMRLVRSGATAAVGGRRERQARDVLVVLQFALALSLLLGAGLLVQSFRRLLAVPLGYDPRGVISFAIGPTTHAYDAPAAAANLWARIVEAERAVPGVEHAAITGGALLQTSVVPEGAASSGQPMLQALYHTVSTDYLRTMRIPLVAGRWFTEADMRAPMSGGLVVDQTLARRLGGNPIGRRITIRRQSQARADVGAPITLPIIGVVGDVLEFGPGQDTGGEVYLPYTLEVWPWMTFAVRATNAPSAEHAVEAAVRRVEPAIRFRFGPTISGSGVDLVGAQRRFVTTVLTGFAGLALLLAAIGLYGIVAYGVAQRTREIGVRMALGATERRIVSLVVREAAVLVVFGAVGGGLLGWASTRLIRALLFGTSAADPETLIGVTLVLGLVAVAAVYGPARRAARIDPVIAIRGD
ncbi:MAG TPA: ADOP family duplicated permease [Gemmatimonadaceae bacterium]